jgi:GH24 family phage-related lysozyme (muramidase)
MIKGLFITMAFLFDRMPILIAQDCEFIFSEKGYNALKCMEGFVDGCYLDSQCYWTLWWGHLVGKDKSKAVYEECCTLRANNNPQELFKADVEKLVKDLNSGLAKTGPKFCRGGRNELTQGEYDALLTARYQGALLYKWFKNSKDALNNDVRDRTEKFGGAKRLKLFDKLWMNKELDCKIDTFLTEDKEAHCINKCKAEKELCKAASNRNPKECYPMQKPQMSPTKKPTVRRSKAPPKVRTKTPTNIQTQSPTAIPTILPSNLPLTLPPEGLPQPLLAAPTTAPPFQEFDQGPTITPTVRFPDAHSKNPSEVLLRL